MQEKDSLSEHYFVHQSAPKIVIVHQFVHQKLQLKINYPPKADKKQTEFNNFIASLRLARHPLGEAFLFSLKNFSKKFNRVLYNTRLAKSKCYNVITKREGNDPKRK